MKNLNKRAEFEDKFRQVFEGAENPPPEGVWDKIDAALSKGEAARLRKRAAWYKLLAAASVAFALGVGIFSVNHMLSVDQPESLASQQKGQSQNTISEDQVQSAKNIPDEISNDENTGIESAKVQGELNDRNIAYETLSTSSTIPSQPSGSKKSSESHEPTVSDSWENYDNISNIDNRGEPEILLAENDDQMVNREILGFRSLAPLGVDAEQEENIYTLDHIYYVPYIPSGAFKKSKKGQSDSKGPILLAGLDFSAGRFDPKFQSGTSSVAGGGAYYSSLNPGATHDQLTTFNTANKDFLVVRSAGEEVEPEFTYSYGANVGVRIVKRLVIQTGFEYRKANSVIKTTGYLSNAEDGSNIPIVASYSYQPTGLSSVKRVSETSLNNQYEFASIPVRLGYMVLDKKFNITVLAGMSPEFFLGNKIEDPSGFFNTLSNGTGLESPYKNVYFNGSVGTMLGYTFAGQYSITVEPKYRFALNSFTKEGFYLNSYPASFMVSFGVSYNFK